MPKTSQTVIRIYQSCTKKDSKLTQIVKILVVKMNIPEPNKSYQVTQQQLLQLPKSRYRPDDYLEKLSSPQHEAVLTTPSMHGDSDATLLYSSSDETIPYWTLSNDNASTNQSPLNKHNKIDITTNIKCIKNQKKPTKRRLNISVHGIRKYHQHYYFKCVETSCNRTFNKVRDWNTHHHMMHKYKLKCDLCGRKFVTPSTHRAHRNYHAPHKYTCVQCEKTFAFESGLKQHKIIHTHSKLNRCFTDTCTKAFKWLQDLVHHIKRHMQEKWLCKNCDMVFAEKRLLKRNEHKHIDTYRYRCNKCDFKSKWPTPYKRHLKLHS